MPLCPAAACRHTSCASSTSTSLPDTEQPKRTLMKGQHCSCSNFALDAPRGLARKSKIAKAGILANEGKIMFNVSSAMADGSRTVGVIDVARPRHLPPLPTRVSRWMNDSDLGMTDYNLSHHSKSSGDSAATCQALCDALRCVAPCNVRASLRPC